MSPTRTSSEALFGTVLEGLYRIDGLIGEGGMGAVYEAAHLRLGKRVAVKVMAREFAASEEALARFHREAQVTSGLGHPHIVQVFDFSTTPDGNPFIVMECLEGEDLEHRLRRVGRLPAPDVAHMVKQVASALTATHGQGIVHRDLKPGNIYLLEVAGETDFVKVLDFGISKVRSAATKLTRAAEIIGTPNYMSPEQALGRVDEVDDCTDQWALACIAWECLMGHCVFAGDNAHSILFQVVHEPIPRIDSTTVDFPPQVEAVLLKALAKNKNERFANVNDFAVALEKAALGLPLGQESQPAPASRPKTQALAWDPATAPLATSLPSTFTQTAGELDAALDEVPSHAKWGWAAIIGVVAALLVGGLWLLRAPPEPKPVVVSPSPQPSVAAAPAPLPPAPRIEPVAAPTPSPAPAQKPEPPPTLGDAPAGKLEQETPATTEKPTRLRREDGQDPPRPQPSPKSKSKILRTL